MPTMKKSLLFFVLALLWVSCYVANNDYTEYATTFEEQFSVDPGGTLSISQRDGDIRIESWERSAVDIEGRMSVRADSEEAAERAFARRRAEKRGNEVVLAYEPSRSGTREVIYRKIDYRIKAPEDCNLRLKIDDGEISITGLAGDLRIEGDDISGEISGGADLLLTSDDGTITLAALDGTIFVKADDANIFLEDIDSPEITISTDDGDIEGDLTMHEGGEYSFTTDDGDIILRLPGDTASRVAIEKDDGRFETDFPFLLRRTAGHERIEGVIGSESAATVIKTDDGDVALRSMDER